ncbi:MAG: hypothetical protein KDA32_04165 [Phycisphaerales bacterium]|nr:hypothetical protein [Phycisphaerales bacterium]
MPASWKLRLFKIIIPAGCLFALGECGLTDQQLSSIVQSALSTGLNSLVTVALAGAAAAGG